MMKVNPTLFACFNDMMLKFVPYTKNGNVENFYAFILIYKTSRYKVSSQIESAQKPFRFGPKGIVGNDRILF